MTFHFRRTTGYIALLSTIVFCAAFLGLPAQSSAAAKINIPFEALSLNPGLVGWWTFDGKNIIQNVTDLSGQGRNGTLTSGFTATTTVAGKLGQALKFDGVNDAVSLSGKAFNNLSSGSMSYWFKTSSFAGGYVAYEDGAGFNNFGAQLPGTSGSAAVFELGGTSKNSTKTSWLTNRWYMLTITWGSETRIYVDGELDNTIAGAASTQNRAGDNTQFGRYCYTGCTGEGGYMMGTLDDIRAYNRVLSAAEIKRLYQFGGGYGGGARRGTRVAEAGMVGHWTMDNRDISGTNAYDISGSGSTGTITGGATTATGKLNQAISLGSGKYISMTTQDETPFTTGKISMSAWIKANSFTSGAVGNIVIYGSSGGVYCSGPFLQTNATGITAGFQQLGTGEVVANTDTLETGRWYHILWTFDPGDALRLYVNGGLYATTSPSYTLNTPSQIYNLYFGSNILSANNGTAACGGGPYYFDGSIDDIRIYSRALSATEAKRLYAEGTLVHASVNTTLTPLNLKSGLVGHWTFDGKDMIQNVADRSGQGNTGRLVNFTSTTTTAGKVGQALSLNGVTNAANLGNSTKTSSTQTIAFWVYERARGSYALFSANLGSSGSAHYNEIWSFTGAINYVNTSASSVPIGYTLPLAKWTHLAFTMSGTNLQMYVDGVLNASKSDANFDSRYTPLILGAWQNDSSTGSPTASYFNGYMDDVRIYNRVLSATEVMQLYKLGK